MKRLLATLCVIAGIARAEAPPRIMVIDVNWQQLQALEPLDLQQGAALSLRVQPRFDGRWLALDGVTARWEARATMATSAAYQASSDLTTNAAHYIRIPFTSAQTGTVTTNWIYSVILESGGEDYPLGTGAYNVAASGFAGASAVITSSVAVTEIDAAYLLGVTNLAVTYSTSNSLTRSGRIYSMVLNTNFAAAGVSMVDTWTAGAGVTNTGTAANPTGALNAASIAADALANTSVQPATLTASGAVWVARATNLAAVAGDAAYYPLTTNPSNFLTASATNQAWLLPGATNFAWLLPGATNIGWLLPEATNQPWLLPAATNFAWLLPAATNQGWVTQTAVDGATNAQHGADLAEFLQVDGGNAMAAALNMGGQNATNVSSIYGTVNVYDPSPFIDYANGHLRSSTGWTNYDWVMGSFSGQQTIDGHPVLTNAAAFDAAGAAAGVTNTAILRGAITNVQLNGVVFDIVNGVATGTVATAGGAADGRGVNVLSNGTLIVSSTNINIIPGSGIQTIVAQRGTTTDVTVAKTVEQFARISYQATLAAAGVATPVSVSAALTNASCVTVSGNFITINNTGVYNITWGVCTTAGIAEGGSYYTQFHTNTTAVRQGSIAAPGSAGGVMFSGGTLLAFPVVAGTTIDVYQVCSVAVTNRATAFHTFMDIHKVGP